MLGEFTYCNPTRLYFGKESLNGLKQELSKYGPTVQLCYGGGSIKKNGIYDQVVAILKDCGKTVIEDAGVMPNPTVQKLYEGCRLAKENKVDLILAVGGGSVCDYAKAVSVSAYCESDPWEKYYLHMEEVDNTIIPVGCVLTLVGTGSELNGGAATTTQEQKLKVGHVVGITCSRSSLSSTRSLPIPCPNIRWWLGSTIFSTTSPNSIFPARMTTPPTISPRG